MISYNNSNWAAVYLNLRKSWRWWGVIGRVLEKTRVTVRSEGEIYKALVESVLLCGSKSWVVTEEILKVLTEFCQQAAPWIMVMTAKHGAGREWGYPAVEEAMDSAGIHPMIVYIKRRQTTIYERLSCWPVYAFCMEVERMSGTSLMVRRNKRGRYVINLTEWDQFLISD